MVQRPLRQRVWRPLALVSVPGGNHQAALASRVLPSPIHPSHPPPLSDRLFRGTRDARDTGLEDIHARAPSQSPGGSAGQPGGDPGDAGLLFPALQARTPSQEGVQHPAASPRQASPPATWKCQSFPMKPLKLRFH